MVDTLKSRARTRAFAARALAHAEAAQKDPRATAHLLDAIAAPAGKIVSGYIAMRSEIDPTSAMAHLHRAGARICVPVMAGRGLPLDFREWTPGCALIDGPFGVRVPASGDWLVPDTLIVPLVGFDAHLHRLGYGGGFYDRTLARLRATAPIRAIGFAYAAQELDDLPIEFTDQRLDMLITEDGPVAPKVRR